MEMDVAPDAN